jgi:hypothetical protein
MSKKPDLDLLALAGMTKAGLKDISSSSMGSNAHADKIDLRKIAGLDAPRKMNGKAPNLLAGMDFVEMPKSRPLGQVDMDGMELPDLPQVPEQRPVEFADIPDSIRANVMNQLEHLNDDPRQRSEVPPQTAQAPEPEVVQPSPEMDFDLFQFSMIKDMIKNLDVSIDAMEGAIKHLTDKRDMLMGLIKGEADANGQG